MRIGKTLPPAAAPLSLKDLINGISGLINPDKYLTLLQKSVCNKFNKKHAFFLSSGKAAITMSLKALSIQHPGRNEVVIPAFDCYSVPSSIIRAGLTVRPCEIDIETLQLNKEALEEILLDSSKILAVMPTHLFGLPEDMTLIRKIIIDRDITIIEDAAQAMGCNYNGKFLGTDGDIGIFSFARGKAVSAGEGGVIITDSDKIAGLVKEQLDSTSSYPLVNITKLIVESIALTILINPYLFWLPRMIPFLKLGETVFDSAFPIFKFSGFQAGLAKNLESKIESLSAERSKRLMMYSDQLSGIDTIKVICSKYDVSSLSCIRFPVLFTDSSDVERLLNISDREGLGIAGTYPDAISSLPQIGHMNNSFGNAEKAAKMLLTLPCHSMANINDILRIIQVIRDVVIK